MDSQLDFVLKRLDSRQLANLWTFYRDYFHSDADCFGYLSAALQNEPEPKEIYYQPLSEISEDSFKDALIPRRMLNSVMRLVLAARDMELIRRGKDSFKLLYIFSCVETLTTLAEPNSNKSKREMFSSFFEENLLYNDEILIKKLIKRRAGDEDFSFSDTELSIREFANILYEFRNSAAHEGQYWDCCFKNSRGDYPMSFLVEIDIQSFKRKAKKEHCYTTELDYRTFDGIFVRICIQFIQNYINRRLDPPLLKYK